MLSKIVHFVWEYKVWTFILSLIGLPLAVSGMISAWDTLRHRFWDSAVYDLLADRIPRHEIEGFTFYPLSTEDIARKLSRSEKSVLSSLRRLKKGKMGDQVVEGRYGWFSKDNAPKH